MPCARQTGRIIKMFGLEQQLIWNASQKQEEKRWTFIQCAFKNRLNTGLGNPVQMQPSTPQDLLLKISRSFPSPWCLLSLFWSKEHQTQLQSLTSSLRCTCSPAEVNFVAEKQVIVLKSLSASPHWCKVSQVLVYSRGRGAVLCAPAVHALHRAQHRCLTIISPHLNWSGRANKITGFKDSLVLEWLLLAMW